MAYYLGVEIKDEALSFLYGRSKCGHLYVLDEKEVVLERGMICNGVIKDREGLKALLIQWLDKKKWYPEGTSILISPHCVMRREIYIPKFMENHIEAYLATYPEEWMDQALQDYVFTAHRMTGTSEHRSTTYNMVESKREDRGEGRGRRSKNVRQTSKGLETDRARYCLVGGMKEAIIEPYHLFKELKCMPNFISTPLDVALYSIEGSKEEYYQMLLLEAKGEWYVGIYEGDICILTFILPSRDQDKLLLEVGKLLQFYTFKYGDRQIEKCYVMWQGVRDQAFEGIIGDTFELEVVSLENNVGVNSLLMGSGKRAFIRRSL